MIPVMPTNDNKKTSKSDAPHESPNLVAPAASNQLPSNSLERGLRMIEMIASSKNGLSNKEISEELCIATSSCSYVLGRLEREGYLSRNAATGRYQLGLKVLAISRGVLRHMHFREVAEPVLQRLRDDTGLEGVVGVLDQNRVMVINRVPNGEFPRADVDTGTVYSAHSTAIGKVLLARVPKERILDLIAEYGLVRHTQNTIASGTELLVELDRIRKSGYAVSNEEQRLGLRSVAAPIIDSQRAVRAGVAAVGSTNHPVWRDMAMITERVKTAAREISRLVRFK
jgi:DNA-binding IclR family transcriptional regulator